MKSLLMIILIALYSCRTTKLDIKTGERNPTWTKKHFDRVHPYGFHVRNRYIESSYPVKLPTSQNK